MANSQTNYEIKNEDFFNENIWNELNRYNVNGVIINSVTCTEDNIDNLFESQFEESTRYGEVYRYSLASE